MDSYAKTLSFDAARRATTASLKRLVRKGCRTKAQRNAAIQRAGVRGG